MKLNAGVVTPLLKETRQFYTEKLGFGIRFQNDWYLLLHTPGGDNDLAFLAPDLDNQAPVFQRPYTGNGMFITIEVPDVQKIYDQVKSAGASIYREMKKEDWGDTHFIVVDPNGIGIDFVQYEAPAE